MKIVVRRLIILLCISLLSVCLVGCDNDDNTIKHEFSFDIPDNFDSLALDSLREWAREEGHIVINCINNSVVENEKLLYSFLRNTTEEKELLIIQYSEHEGKVKNTATGIYFDGTSYYTKSKYGKLREGTLYKYGICDIEEYDGNKYLYLSNYASLTKEDENLSLESSDFADFEKKYQSIASVGKVVECGVTIQHKFSFNTPDNFDSLSVEERLDWAKENGYLVIDFVDGNYVVYSKEPLYSFLENKTEKKELLIIQCYEYKGKLETALSGIYFDGTSYYAEGKYATLPKGTLYKYEICDIEVWHGSEYLFVSNNRKLTNDDELSAIAYSRLEEFVKQYQSVARLGKIE